MRIARIGCIFLFALSEGTAACRGQPPAPAVDASASPIASAGAGASSSPVVVASAPPVDAGKPLVDAGPDPGTLPQTRDKPETNAAFEDRIKLLWEAIQKDDPDHALPAFFPVTAYEQVKGIPNPSSDWRRRLVAAYKRDIHALAKRLGDVESKLLRVEVPDDRARWVEPGEESNKLGYYRVYGTKMIYEVEGKERSFEISSLISWRGEWYVVHLTGFK